jgi:hypothetical protein
MTFQRVPSDGRGGMGYETEGNGKEWKEKEGMQCARNQRTFDQSRGANAKKEEVRKAIRRAQSAIYRVRESQVYR